MQAFKSVALAAVVSVLGSAISAGNIVASDPEVLLTYFFEQGIPAKLTVDDYGDPKIDARYFGTNFKIYYYGCTGGENCRSIQFFSGYQTDGRISLEQINSWNTTERYARAYLSENLSARIEYDVQLGSTGMTEEDFDSVFSLWTRSVENFEEFIDW
ncbi:MAG: YbjN domain-containing protein [Paracoccaceae bacterium]